MGAARVILAMLFTICGLLHYRVALWICRGASVVLPGFQVFMPAEGCSLVAPRTEL